MPQTRTRHPLTAALSAGAALTACLWLPACGSCHPSPELPSPPETRVDDTVETIHGVAVHDPYRWLEKTDSPETRAWIEAQNNYTDAILRSLPGRDEMRERLTRLLYHDSYYNPLPAGGRTFFMKHTAMTDQAVIAMRVNDENEDITLVDPLPWSEDHKTSVRLVSVSHDGRRIAYLVREGGKKLATVRLFDVDRRKDLPDTLPAARYLDADLSPDGHELYYATRKDERSHVLLHQVGDTKRSDRPIPSIELSKGQSVRLSLSTDGRHLLLVVSSGSSSRSSLYLYNTARNSTTTIAEDIDGTFVGAIGGGQLYLATDWKAPWGRVLVTSLDRLSRKHWRELVPARRGEVLESMTLAGGQLFLRYLEDVKSRIVRFSAEGKKLGEIRFEGIGSVSAAGGHWDHPVAYFTFESFHRPPTIYRYDTRSGLRSIWAQPEIPVDPDKYNVQQRWYRSKDGTRVPIFVVHRKGARLDGTTRTVLSGYGNFGVSLTPHFSVSAVTWLDGGGMFAIPNLRGGGEFGKKWHDAAKGRHKQVAVDDFIAAADWLVAEGYCSPKTLAFEGNGAGGLIVGAAINQRPELAKAAIFGAPMFDMVRYESFENAALWSDEFGRVKNAEDFAAILALSPYHHVVRGTRYPAVFCLTGAIGTRMSAVHGFKLAAVLQARSSSGLPVLLRYFDPAEKQTDRPFAQAVETASDAHLFLMWQLGALARTP